MSQASYDKNKYKVKEIIQNYLSLEKRGRNYWAICPFHDDNRASLSVSEEKNIFKCFSCGAAGNAISFIMRKENLNLTEALFKAHQILNLPTEELQRFKREAPEEEFKKKLLSFNSFLLDFFKKSLFSPLGKDALTYLQQKRQLTQKIIDQYNLGYAPPGNELLKTIENLQKVSPEFQFLNNKFLVQTGLFNQLSSSCVPVFKNKIIIPIFSLENQVLSFSARALPGTPESEPRYMHSRETILFKKSKLLYNLPTLHNISKDSYIYLFEGFFDLFAAELISPGKPYLAILGSELSNETLQLLSKLPSKKVVIALDNDSSGKSASLKIFKKLISFGFSPYALPLSPSLGKDLSEMVCKNPNFTLPEPILFIEWMKSNWEELFQDQNNIQNIFSVNQLVISFLQSIFFISSDGRNIYLTKNISHQDAVTIVEDIFKLFSSLNLTTREQQAVFDFKSKYLEAINLSLLSTNQLDHQIFERESENAKENNLLTHNYSSILSIWSKLLKFNSTSIFLQTRRKQWESNLLKKYSEYLKLSLHPEEQSFIYTLNSQIDQLSKHLTPMKSRSSPQESIQELLSFLELYYSLIYRLLEKYEEISKKGLELDLPQKMKIWNELSEDKENLMQQSKDTFQSLIEWEKNLQ